jgi:hypothetical protein
MEAYEEDKNESENQEVNLEPLLSESEFPAEEPDVQIEPGSAQELKLLESEPVKLLTPDSRQDKSEQESTLHDSRWSKKIIAIVFIAVVMMAGLTGGLVYYFSNGHKSECETRFTNLTEEAKRKLTSIKTSLNDCKKRAELCESTTTASTSGAAQTLGIDEENILYVNREFLFALRLPKMFSEQRGVCVVDDGGSPNLSVGAGVPLSVVQEPNTGNFYFIPEFHYETLNTEGVLGCHRIDHDVVWAQGVSAAPSLVVTVGVQDVTMLRELINQKTGSSVCADSMEMSLVAGNDFKPVLFRVGFKSVDCSAGRDSSVWYSPKTGSLFWVNFAQGSSSNIYFPDDIIGL